MDWLRHSTQGLRVPRSPAPQAIHGQVGVELRARSSGASERNEDAARFSGINTRFVIATAYAGMGLLTGIAAAVLGGCGLRRG